MRLFSTTCIGLAGLLLLGLQSCTYRSQELPTPASMETAIAVGEAQAWYQNTTSLRSSHRQAAPSSALAATQPTPPALQWDKLLL
jgi:hypothetical protein